MVNQSRTRINFYYQVKAQRALEDQNGNHPPDDDFSFILNVGPTFDIFPFKKVILQELGRLGDPVSIRNVAREICKKKLYTMEAVTYIRRFRVGDIPSGSNIDLAKAIGKFIDEYNLKHSGVNNEMIRESLNTVLKEFK